MKQYFIFLTLITVSLLQAQAQSLYTPRNVKETFEKGSRSLDGKPGPHYWQNHSNYMINLIIAPPNRMIKGAEQITYFNDSPDTLKYIVFSLLMNYHRPAAARLSNLDPQQLTRGIQIDHFKINGNEKEWPVLHGHYTWQQVHLSQALLPGDSIHFSFQWHYKIATASVRNQRAIREGSIDPTTYAIAYFYPCVAVYDDYNGWNTLQFTGAQEFYNDFGNYTLKVQVPKNYITWATGTLQNPDAVLQPHYAKLLKESMTSGSVIHIATPKDLGQENITQQNTFNTWIWKAKDVTEVALFISNHDNWDAASVVVDPKTGRRASVQSAYYDSSKYFHHAVAIGQKALGWYSRHLPGVPYPYPKMTVVEGYAGMEYPMMANDGSKHENSMLNYTYVENHEIAHTYFPFYMGINESRYAFMDEGWAQTFNGLIGTAEYGAPVVNKGYEKVLIRDKSQGQQVPVIASDFQTGRSYTNNAYFKPMLAYMALKNLLGDQLFKKCLVGYITRWHGKHPIPWDFFDSFNNISGKDLNWFWNSWFFSHGYTDIGVENVAKRGRNYSVLIKNTGGFDIPFDIKIVYKDSSQKEIHETPIVWKKDSEQAVIDLRSKKKIKSLNIETGLWADANEKDNVWQFPVIGNQ